MKKEPILPMLAKACNDCEVAYISLDPRSIESHGLLMDECISAYYNFGFLFINKMIRAEEKAE